MRHAPHIDMRPLPALFRFYFYGIQGFCDEIVFTSLLHFYQSGNWALKGDSAISSFFIYGTICFFVERLYVWLYYSYGFAWYLRMPLYMCILYSWEFTTGFILRQFNACPWDYSHYTYNFMGLITLEYAPGWLILCALQDIFAEFLLRLRILPDSDLQKSTATTNGAIRKEQ